MNANPEMMCLEESGSPVSFRIGLKNAGFSGRLIVILLSCSNYSLVLFERERSTWHREEALRLFSHPLRPK